MNQSIVIGNERAQKCGTGKRPILKLENWQTLPAMKRLIRNRKPNRITNKETILAPPIETDPSWSTTLPQMKRAWARYKQEPPERVVQQRQ